VRGNLGAPSMSRRAIRGRTSPTPAAVSLAVKRGRIKGIAYDRTKGSRSGVPWHPIKPEHRDRFLAKMLRAAARSDRGLTNAPPIEQRLRRFLRSADQEDFVIHYDPDTPDGFYRVPRRPGIDLWLVRDPHRRDDGSLA